MKVLIEVKTNRINRYFECTNIQTVFHKILPKIDDLGSYIGCKKTESTAEDLYNFDYFITIKQVGKNKYEIHLFDITNSSMDMIIQVDYDNWLVKFIKMFKRNANLYSKIINLFKIRFRNYIFEKEFKFIEIWKEENNNEII